MTDHLEKALDLLEEAMTELTPLEGLTMGGDDFANWRAETEALLAATRPKPMTNIETFSGIGFDLLRPRSEDVCLSDIAHSLAHINRFVGHTGRGYSVAEHALWVWLVVALEHPDDYALQLEALGHDNEEAYTGDLSGPLKATLRMCRGVYDHRSPLDDIAAGVRQVIRAHFGLGSILERHRRYISIVDQRMRETERRCPVLMPNTRDENWPKGFEPYQEILDGTLGLTPRAILPEGVWDGEMPESVSFPASEARLVAADAHPVYRPISKPLSEKDIAFLFEQNFLRLLALVKGSAP